MEQAHCDGLLVHPVIGKKKSGDFNAKYIIKAYEKMMHDVYPKAKVIFAVFPVCSHYAGPREAIFTAICRQNYGCTHFVVGRDHTGVDNYYHPNAAHQIFEKVPELKIKPIFFNRICYSQKMKQYLLENEMDMVEGLEEYNISGTKIRSHL